VDLGGRKNQRETAQRKGKIKPTNRAKNKQKNSLKTPKTGKTGKNPKNEVKSEEKSRKIEQNSRKKRKYPE
jgi:hypothetical protein